ncbi:hypothetical protein [Parageobacillus thermantarcticus]|nr:hypothetical protein [Parageobacillus thermantarcticus]
MEEHPINMPPEKEGTMKAIGIGISSKKKGGHVYIYYIPSTGNFVFQASIVVHMESTLKLILMCFFLILPLEISCLVLKNASL